MHVLILYAAINLNVGPFSLPDYLSLGRTGMAYSIPFIPLHLPFFSVFRCKSCCSLLPSAGCKVNVARLDCKHPFRARLLRDATFIYETRFSIPWSGFFFFSPRWKHYCFPAFAVWLATASTNSASLKVILSTFNCLSSKACKKHATALRDTGPSQKYLVKLQNATSFVADRTNSLTPHS